MHKEAKREAENFANRYLKSKDLKILDVGSVDFNGSLREVFEKFGEYKGLDVEAGNNVDIIGDLYSFPIQDNTFDVIVSSSCFEHAKFFWITFNEMVRVLKPNGLMYINTPSTGGYHGYPVDCWRFYKDSYQALAEWNGKVELIEQYELKETHWNDNIGIFKKS